MMMMMMCTRLLRTSWRRALGSGSWIIRPTTPDGHDGARGTIICCIFTNSKYNPDTGHSTIIYDPNANPSFHSSFSSPLNSYHIIISYNIHLQHQRFYPTRIHHHQPPPRMAANSNLRFLRGPRPMKESWCKPP
jgi:hypothetical protein